MIRLVVAILLLTLGVSGQTSNTICTKNEPTSFLFNANDESPCLVWSKLQSLCLPQERFINVPPLIDRTWGYNPVMPDEKDSLCQCNVVAYALMAGCSWCQLGDTSSSSWVTEQRWRQDCTTYNESSVSFAQIVLPLPTYVFHRWMDLRWDPAAAMAASRGPPAVAPTIATSTLFRSFLPSPTSTLTKPSGSPKPSSPPSDDDLSNQDGKSSPARIGAIIGGVVGGVMLLIIIMLVFAYWKKQHRFQKDQAEGKEGGSEPEYGAGMARRGAPVGLPSFPDPYVQGRGGGPTTGIVEMLKNSVQSGRERGTERVSRWSENFFTNPRKAPMRPPSSQLKDGGKSKYTTTTDRRRDKGVSSSTSGGSSFDVTFNRSATLPSETWKLGRDGAVWPVQAPRTATSQASAMDHNAKVSERDRAHLSADTTGSYQEAPQNPTRKIAPLSHPRESFAERWSDQSSVFTFAASKANQRETLPFFSTSVKDNKNHRTELAKKVADEEARTKARDEREWQEAKDMPPDRMGLGDSSESPRDIVLGSGAGMKGSKKKTKKSGSRTRTREEGVDEMGVKLKKTKKKKKRSSNTPGPSHPSSLAPTSNRSSVRLSTNTRQPLKSAFNRRALSAHSVAPSDIPEYANKPLPEPPTPLGDSRSAGIDFSAATQRTPTISTPIQPRPVHPFARIGRRVSTTFSPADRVNFPEPHTAQSRSYPTDFPSPAPYNPRSSSSQQMSTSRSAQGGTKGRMGDADFSQPRPSPNPTLPSMYEPKTGAGVFDPLLVPPQHDTMRGHAQSDSDSGTPVSRHPTSVLRIVD